MLIFFQNKFTSFDSKKNVPRSVQSDDGMNWLQQAEQYRVVLSTKIETAQINSRSKERFRREAKLILQKNNPLEQLYDLEQSLQKYEEFVLGMRTNFLYQRDGFLIGEFSGIPFWGGTRIAFENELLPREVVAEKIFWLHKFVEPLYDEQVNPAKIAASELSATVTKMMARMQKIEIEAERRKKQIADFLAVREQHSALVGRFKKLFSQKVFARASFDERRNILMRIGDQIRVVEKSGEFLENQENKFAAELQSKIDVAKSLPPSDGWAELRAEEIKLQRPPKQIKKLEFFKIWANKFRAEQKKNENGITTRLNEIQRNFTEKKSVAVLQKDREWLAKLNPRFKLEAKITPAPIPLELELLAQLKIAGESADTPTSSPRENLFLAQKNNEFIRRMLIQIAALAMAMGQTSTANETQKQIVKGQDLRERKNFKTTEEEKFKQAAAQQTTRQVSGAEIGANTDTLAAVKDPNVVQIHNSCAEIREESQLGFQIDSWEMTRFNGTKPWPPHELQKYLQDVRRSGHHLALTNNYLMVGHGFAMNLLKQITVANFIELLGNSAREKKICKDEIFSLINEAGGGKADDLDRRIFSYTPNE